MEMSLEELAGKLEELVEKREWLKIKELLPRMRQEFKKQPHMAQEYQEFKARLISALNEMEKQRAEQKAEIKKLKAENEQREAVREGLKAELRAKEDLLDIEAEKRAILKKEAKKIKGGKGFN